MKKIIAIAAIVAATSMTSASAFWGNGPFSNTGSGAAPWSTFGDMFGMNEVNFSAKNQGRVNGNGYGNPYAGYNSYGTPSYGYAPYGYAPYGAPYGAAPVAPVAPAAPVAQ